MSNAALDMGQSPLVEAGFRHALLLHRPFPYFHRSDDGLGQWLRILLLYECLYVFAVDFLSCRVILLVLMQYDGIVHRFYTTLMRGKSSNAV